MKTVSCSNCGTTIGSDQRFCRKCGQPINFSEATTRTLDPPSVIEPSTLHINSTPTSPSYFPPDTAQPMPAPTTTELRSSPQKRMMIVMVGLIGFLAVALIVLAVIASRISRNAAAEQPAMTQPQIPSPPSVTQRPPIPPVPQAPPAPSAPSVTTGGATTISRELVYPGAKITTEINRSEGGSALQLQTDDPFDKVVAWYTAKLKPVKTIRTLGPTAILQGQDMSAIINGTDNGASIFLKKE